MSADVVTVERESVVTVVSSGAADITITAIWGQILGDIANQLDLQAALAAKQNVLTEGPFVDGDKTKLDSIGKWAAHYTGNDLPGVGNNTLADGESRIWNQLGTTNTFLMVNYNSSYRLVELTDFE